MKTYIQITGGRGPIECARVVMLVTQYLQKRFPKLELIDYEQHKDDESCLMSAILTGNIDGQMLEVMKADYEGTICWIATKNHFRPNHKRKNWYVGINFFSEADTIKIDDKDIIYETSRSSGAGGQNVNKVESAVRAIHVPTGIFVRCEDERSQSMNKAKAKERLILKLSTINDEKKAEQDRKIWINHTMLERGNPKITLKGDL